MSFRYKKTIQAVSLFIFICLANGYIFAVLPDGKTVHPNITDAGVLNAPDAQSIRVNGNSAQDGMTILSGAEIKTGANKGAIIDLRRLGKIEINSETTVKLVYTADRVDLQVLSGMAKMTTYKGVSGVLTDAAGKSLKTDPTLEISSIENGEMAAAGDAVIVPVESSPGLFGAGIWGTVGVVGSVVGGTLLALVNASKSEDVSQSPVSRVRP